MSVADYLCWESGDGLNYELVDGEPRAMAPAGTIHAVLQGELARLIGNHLRAHRPGCRVLTNPGIRPRLLSDHNVRIPDLAVTCAPLVRGQTILADPLLVVEILSPSNQSDTWSNVWAYTSIPGVLEILVLDSRRIAADVLRRGPGGEWPEEPEEVLDRGLTLTSIGFEVPLAEIYAGTGLA